MCVNQGCTESRISVLVLLEESEGRERRLFPEMRISVYSFEDEPETCYDTALQACWVRLPHSQGLWTLPRGMELS